MCERAPRVSAISTFTLPQSAAASHTSTTHCPGHCAHGPSGARSAPVALHATCSMRSREVGAQLRRWSRADAQATQRRANSSPRRSPHHAPRRLPCRREPRCDAGPRRPCGTAQRPWSGQRGSIKPRGKAKGATAGAHIRALNRHRRHLSHRSLAVQPGDVLDPCVAGTGDRPRGLGAAVLRGLVAHAALVGQRTARDREGAVVARCTDRVLHVPPRGGRQRRHLEQHRARVGAERQRRGGRRQARASYFDSSSATRAPWSRRQVALSPQTFRGRSRRRRHGSCEEGWSWRSPESEAELREEPVKLVTRVSPRKRKRWCHYRAWS